MLGIGKIKPDMTPGIQECESMYDALMALEHMLDRKQIPEETQYDTIHGRAIKCIEVLIAEKSQYMEKLNSISKKSSKPAKVIAATIEEIDKQLRYANNAFKNLEHIRERASQGLIATIKAFSISVMKTVPVMSFANTIISQMILLMVLQHISMEKLR